MRISDWSSDVCSSDLPGRTRADDGDPNRLAHAAAAPTVLPSIVLTQARTSIPPPSPSTWRPICGCDPDLCPGRSGFAPGSGGRSPTNAPTGEFEERGYAVGLEGFESHPAFGTEPFEGAEQPPVGHAPGSVTHNTHKSKGSLR